MNKDKLRTIIGVFVVILISIVGGLYVKSVKSRPQDYTIGVIDKIWKPAKGSKQVSYEFLVNGNEYDGNVDYYGYEEIAKPGRRFLVSFPPGSEWASVMLLDHPVPDGIEAPPAGWDEKPNFNQE